MDFRCWIHGEQASSEVRELLEVIIRTFHRDILVDGNIVFSDISTAVDVTMLEDLASYVLATGLYT